MPAAAEMPHLDEIVYRAETEQVSVGELNRWDLDVIAAAGLGFIAIYCKQSEVKTGEMQDVSTN